MNSPIQQRYKWYVLIHSNYPMFISDSDGTPQAYDSADAARAVADRLGMCQAYGFSVILWEPEAGIAEFAGSGS